MRKFEYRCISATNITYVVSEANSAGSDGWQVIKIVHDGATWNAILERESCVEEKKQEKQRKSGKIAYAPYVLMLEKEYDTLVKEIGVDATKGCIEILNNYKGANNKRYKEDYLAIRNWVIEKYNEKQKKEGIDLSKIWNR